MNRNKLLLLCAALLCMAGALPMGAQTTKSSTLTISSSTRYQYIDGFGGTAMTPDWRDVYSQEKVRRLWGTGEGCVGLNIMRLRINPNENNWGEYGNPVKWARQLNPDLQVFATPWTPPKKYKTHNTNKYQNDFGTWVWPLVEHSWGGEGSNGGAINPDCYDDFADFLERYRQTMERKGCPIDIISVQNESDYTPTTTDNGVEHASYESCIYSPKEMAAMVKALRKKLDPSCRVMGPECFGWGQHNYNNTLVTMKDATDNIDVWGNHCYGTNNWDFVQSVTQKSGRHMWMTEFLIDYASGYDGSFSAEYPMIENIEQVMKAGYSAYVYYSMYTHFFASNHGGSDTQLWKRAYVFSHYAKYATGKTRIRSTLSANTALKGGSAYISPSGDTITVMVLNPSATDTYNLTVAIPFIPTHITQVVTGQTVNALRSDVSDKYVNGTSKVRLQLLPGMFYTFQFVKGEAQGPEAEEMVYTPKQPAYGNPLLASCYTADPTAIEHDGRLYVYCTNDQQEFDYTSGLQQNSYGHITQLVCLSTADMVNWTRHGVIDVKAIAPWISTSWAPSIVSREEADGKTHFYLYFTNSANGIGVLTATSPTGPWTDPLGHALIDRSTPGLGTISQIIDPGVCSNGSEAYLTFGGGDVKGTDLQPGNARIVRLGSDMVSLGSDIKPISAPCHFEANELNYMGGNWVFSYCTRWTIASDWSSYSKATAPTPCSIVYLTAKDPLADNWSYKGEVLPNPGVLGYPYGNNHSHLQKFGSRYYLFYHTQWLEQQQGLSGGYRSVQVNPIQVMEARMKIYALDAQTATIDGPQQSMANYVDPFQWQPGNMAAIDTRNWWMVRGVDFGLYGQPARSLLLRVKGTGTLEVRAEMPGATALATAAFAGADEQTIAVDLSAGQQRLCEYLYFVFTQKMSDAEVLGWCFSTQTADELKAAISPIAVADEGAEQVFSPSGMRLQSPRRGLNIVRGADGSSRKVLAE